MIDLVPRVGFAALAVGAFLAFSTASILPVRASGGIDCQSGAALAPARDGAVSFFFGGVLTHGRPSMPFQIHGHVEVAFAESEKDGTTLPAKRITSDIDQEMLVGYATFGDITQLVLFLDRHDLQLTLRVIDTGGDTYLGRIDAVVGWGPETRKLSQPVECQFE